MDRQNQHNRTNAVISFRTNEFREMEMRDGKREIEERMERHREKEEKRSELNVQLLYSVLIVVSRIEQFASQLATYSYVFSTTKRKKDDDYETNWKKSQQTQYWALEYAFQSIVVE